MGWRSFYSLLHKRTKTIQEKGGKDSGKINPTICEGRKRGLRRRNHCLYLILRNASLFHKHDFTSNCSEP